MEIDMPLYQGDDLINVMTIRISPAEGSELPEIEAVELKIGTLTKKFTNPSNPFSINILREESIKLSAVNQCYACIWYYDTVDGQRKLLKKTCEGTLTLATKPEVISNGRYKC